VGGCQNHQKHPPTYHENFDRRYLSFATIGWAVFVTNFVSDGLGLSSTVTHPFPSHP
jgi:hypothetical protein